MTLHIQTYLRNLCGPLATVRNTPQQALDTLKAEFGISSSQHNTYKNLYSLKYSQLDSHKKRGHAIVKECRGLILDSTLGTWNVVARPFDRFFNFGEHPADNVAWETATVQSKIDGSLMILYHYNGNWMVASSGTPAASGPVPTQLALDNPRIFRDLFWEVFGKQIGWRYVNRCLARLPKNITFMLELCTPENRVVVKYPEPKLVLLGARDIRTGGEFRPGEMIHCFPNTSIPEVFPVGSPKEALLALESMKGDQQEGYVVCDQWFRRVKMKCGSYVAMHRLVDGIFSLRRVYRDIIFKGELDEFIAVFPEHKEALMTAALKLNDLTKELSVDYARASEAARDFDETEQQKVFALACKNSRCSGALFSLRAGQVTSIKEYLTNKLHVDALLRVLGHKRKVNK